jgi:hypothetical protein
MRAIVKIFVIAVFAAAILALVTATPSEARRRPTIDNIDACTNGAGDKGCGGAICYCCYDEGPEKGCWICNKDFNDCVWDPAAKKPQPLGVMPHVGVPPAVAPPAAVPPGGPRPLVTPGMKQP